MKPTREDLDRRDLLTLANACATAARLPRRADGSHDLETMFGRSHRPVAVDARRQFYRALSAQGWTDSRIAAFVGRDHATIRTALAKGAST